MAEEVEEQIEETESPTSEEKEAGAGLRYQKSQAVCRRCRRMGQKLFLKGEKCFSQKCPFVRRKYAPGQHGQKPSRTSDYGLQLKAKQKACAIYKLNNKQLRNIVDEASKTPTSTQEKIALLLESRLDSILYQGGLALSRRHGRQLITHGKVKVNSKKVTSPSYKVKERDKIKVDEDIINGNQKDDFKRLQAEKNIPDWIKLEEDNVIEISKINGEEIVRQVEFEIQPIIEFYSR
jgi:small subunit ribosomal protein S4